MATEYFQSELFASEMDAAWLHNIRYDKDQDLSEAQKAKARNNMGAASFGSILKILGHYNTVEELQSNAEQNVGDAYSVGTAVPYKLYIFDGLSDSWLDYGFIRSQDISSRSIQNVAVPVSAWTQETDVLVGYSYKAQIALADSSVECFPIVVFESEQAFSGDFASIAFAVAGYVEIFTKTIPTKDINVAAVTVIVNGGIGKGITNATTSITAGSIKTADLADGVVTAPKIADGAVSQTFTATITAAGWTGDATPYTNDVTVTGLTADDNPFVDMIASSAFETAETEIEAFANIYRMVTAENKLTVYAAEKPTVDIVIQIKVVRK